VGGGDAGRVSVCTFSIAMRRWPIVSDEACKPLMTEREARPTSGWACFPGDGA
jgi:hypothetical protein